MIVAAADGSSLSNPGPSGWAWFIDESRWAAGGWDLGTNNKGELMAVLDLLRATAGQDDELLIYCDSQYVINALTKWLPGWKRKGWKKADGQPVANVDLLQELDRGLTNRRVRFEWVRGHAGHPLNEAADHRARAAALAHQQGTPVDAGPGFASGASPRIATAPIATAPIAAPPVASPPFAAPPLVAASPASPADEEHPVVGLQRSLLTDAVRSDRDGYAALLHPRYVQHDSRGRIAGKGRTLASVRPLDEPTELEVEGVEDLAPWIVLLRWRSRSASDAATHSSVWVRHGDTWRLRFEQATPQAHLG